MNFGMLEFLSDDKTIEVIVVRKRIIVEELGAEWWKQYVQRQNLNVDVITTEHITEMDSNLLSRIKGKNVLLVGGYYRNNMDSIRQAAKNVFVFLNSSDMESQREFFKEKEILRNTKGFLSFVLTFVTDKDPVKEAIAEYLDDCLYSSYPNEISLHFKNGVYAIQGNSDLEKIQTIKTLQDVEKTIEQGKKKREDNLFFAKGRLSRSKIYLVMYEEDIYQVRASIGDTAIEDSCRVLAENSPNGLGFLFRYDLSRKPQETHITCASTKSCKISAGALMNFLVGGGGSKAIGGGSVDSLVFPDQFFEKLFLEKATSKVQREMEK